MLAASPAGRLTLSDAGPDQILFLQIAACEVLISFSALYDFSLAANPCALLTLIVLSFACPVAHVAAARIGGGMLAR